MRCCHDKRLRIFRLLHDCFSQYLSLFLFFVVFFVKMAVFRISEKYQLENRNFKNRKFQNTSTLLSSTFLLLRPFLSDSCFVGRLRCAIWQNGTNPKKSDIGRVVESYFNLPNQYSSSIILTDRNFILTNRTCAIAITADMSFKTALTADFRRKTREAKTRNWRRRSFTSDTGVTDTGKVFMLLGDEGDEKRHVDPENLVLFLTRLKDFLVKRGVKELSLPVYDPNRGRVHPRALYALIHVTFSNTNIQVFLHKKYYLSIG